MFLSTRVLSHYWVQQRMQLCSCTRVKKNQELKKFVGAVSKYVLAVITWMMEPYHPCTPQNKFNSNPKWIQIGNSANHFHSLHTCIWHTLFTVDHPNIHNKASTSCSVALIPIHISTTLTLYSLPNHKSCRKG